jgi:hypothetical protein
MDLLQYSMILICLEVYENCKLPYSEAMSQVTSIQ